MALYLVACVLGAIAVFVSRAGMREAYVIVGAVAVPGLYALWEFEWKHA